MSESTAEQSITPIDSRKLTDLLFPILFCSLAIVATVAWLAAIGWVISLPICYLIAAVFG